ncbi:MAG TPA: class I SAM-dependent methyltransferase [Burkholderiales bacterium]|nr:class I SAM-dependent methyltransferase [Burkholderiales bacterium]
MLGRLIKDWLHARTGRSEARLHEPPVHPAAVDAVRALLREGGRPAEPYDYEQIAYLLAGVSSARYMVEHMSGARNLVGRAALLEYALSQCAVAGLVLEFGVYTGASLKWIADRHAGPIHGFDSFEGLPEDWTHAQKKGRFSLEGELPDIGAANAVLHKGWFADTLPAFLAANPGAVRFAHIDCDLYSSSKTVLELLLPRTVAGTVLVFDEYLNYPGWEMHEHRAFRETIAATGRRYEYLAFASTTQCVAVRMTG